MVPCTAASHNSCPGPGSVKRSLNRDHVAMPALIPMMGTDCSIIIPPMDRDLKCSTINIISQITMLLRGAHIFTENITTDLGVQEK